MKQTPVLAVLALALLFSCKKSSGDGSYHFTATINGKNETFNMNPIATRTYINNTTYLAIAGFVTLSSTGETFQIGLTGDPGGPGLKPGTYTDTTAQFDVSAVYQVSLTEMYIAGSGAFLGSQGSGNRPITNHFKLVISAMDSASVRGTFSGDFFAYSNTDSARKTITNGDFYVKFF